MNELEQKLFEILAPEMDNPNRVLDALTEAFTLIMSVQCADCRKNIARELKRRIPRMLHNANAVGAEFFGKSNLLRTAASSGQLPAHRTTPGTWPYLL